jgi:hypothetical protein
MYKYVSELWIVHMSLTGRRAIARTKPHNVLLDLYLGFDMHHGSEMNLDCCEVMTTTVNYDMIIIILDNIYFMLSCQSIPPKTLILLSGHAKRARHSSVSVLHRPHS